jgi:predicted nucleotidyltransferase
VLDKIEARDVAYKYAERVCEIYEPKQVIIFGSYVNGNPHEDSDIDIAVVFDAVEGNWLETWGDLIRLREGISYDIEAHMLDESCNQSGFLDHIRETGEIIYEGKI